METIIWIWAVASIIGMLTAAIPLLGWLNWINIPSSTIGFLANIILLYGGEISTTSAMLILIVFLFPMILGSIRLTLGGFIL